MGWSQIREDPPNALHLADDLVKALIEMGQPVYQLPQPDGSFADRSHLFESEVEDFSLDEPHVQEQEVKVGTTSEASQTQDRLPLRLQALKIDTHPNPTSRKSSPGSTNSPSSSLFPPSTPTVLAFQPTKGAEGDQPFITVQDWGVEEESLAPSPLKRRGSIPKTALPSIRPPSH